MYWYLREYIKGFIGNYLKIYGNRYICADLVWFEGKTCTEFPLKQLAETIVMRIIGCTLYLSNEIFKFQYNVT